MIVPTAETVKQSFFLKIALELGIPLGITFLRYLIVFRDIQLFTKRSSNYLNKNKLIPGVIGSSGTGKSFLTNSFIRRLSKEKFITNVVNFSARTNVNYTQVLFILIYIN